MSSREFTEWEAFNRISPGEPERSDLQSALICMVIANMLKGRKGRTFEIGDFLLRFKPKKVQARTQREIRLKFEQWRAMHQAWRKQNA